MHRLLRPVALVLLVLAPPRAQAQNVDLTLFVGRAFPIADDRLVLRAPSIPSLPGVEVTPDGTPELRTDGGLVLGGALAVQFGALGIEGRLDAAEIGFDFSGARYELEATRPPLQGLMGSVTLGDGELDAERINLLSLNLRLRTPGPVGLIASGGLSYLPDVTITGSVPLTVQVAGLPVLPGIQPRLRILAAPGGSGHRWGVNGGAGLRLGGRVSLVAEARVFYFEEYELRFQTESGPAWVDELFATAGVIRFEPIIVNAQAGLSFRF